MTKTDIRGRIALTFDGTTDSPWGPLTSALAIGSVREFSTARITYDIELVP